jgi:RHS repeat-associated protein
LDTEDILFEYDGNNTLTARYTHGPGIDDPIALERGGQSFFYHTDGLGSITEITDSSRQVVSSYSYDAFGNITSKTGTLTTPYTYTGREHDAESGLYYYRARYYDPTIGRFLQPDPLDMATIILIRQYFPGSPISGVLYHFSLKNPLITSNLYLYVGNNPINRIDPFGLQWHKSPAVWLDIIALGADIGGYLLGYQTLLDIGLLLSFVNTIYTYGQWQAGQAEWYDFVVSATTTAIGAYPHPVTVIGADIVILIYDIIRAEQAYSKVLGWCPGEIEYPREPIEKIIPPGMPMP